MPLLEIWSPIKWCSPIRRMVYFTYAWVIEITLVSALDNLVGICLHSRESSSTWNTLWYEVRDSLVNFGKFAWDHEYAVMFAPSVQVEREATKKWVPAHVMETGNRKLRNREVKRRSRHNGIKLEERRLWWSKTIYAHDISFESISLIPVFCRAYL